MFDYLALMHGSHCKEIFERVKMRGSHWQKLYVNTHGNMLELTMVQFIGNFRMFVQHWIGDDLLSGATTVVRQSKLP